MRRSPTSCRRSSRTSRPSSRCCRRWSPCSYRSAPTAPWHHVHPLYPLRPLQAPLQPGKQLPAGTVRQLRAAQQELGRGGSLAAPFDGSGGSSESSGTRQAETAATPHEGFPASSVATGRPPPPKLTNRERTVLELVAEGKLNREIASEISITTRVVEKYVARLLEKTGTSNRTQLVRRALQIGLLSTDPPFHHL